MENRIRILCVLSGMSLGLGISTILFSVLG